MPLEGLCAHTSAVINRARSLYGDEAATIDLPVPNTQAITHARQTVTNARQQMASMSGRGALKYQGFAEASSHDLHHAALADATIGTQLTHASEAVAEGRARLDTVLADNRHTTEAAATADTAAQQRMVVQALRTQIAQTQQVVTTTQQRDATTAGAIRAVDYTTSPQAPPPTDPQPPDDHRPGSSPTRTPLGPAAPLQDPSQTRWNGPPPPGQAAGTGYWAVDISRPTHTPAPLPAPNQYHSAPPPCSFLTGAPSGVLTVGGDSPQKEEAFGFDLQNTYKFRISGSTFSGQTEMAQLGGTWYQAQWHSYDYEMNKIPVISGAGQIPAVQVPVMSQANTWTPVTLGQIASENAQYDAGTFYLPNAFGEPLQVTNGRIRFSTAPVPVITRPR